MKIFCPKCYSDQVLTERRPNGNRACRVCRHLWPASQVHEDPEPQVHEDPEPQVHEDPEPQVPPQFDQKFFSTDVANMPNTYARLGVELLRKTCEAQSVPFPEELSAVLQWTIAFVCSVSHNESLMLHEELKKLRSDLTAVREELDKHLRESPWGAHRGI
jgi:hypothetical protein